MPHLLAMVAKVSGVGFDPRLYVLLPGASEFTQITLPSNVLCTGRRPWYFTFGRRVYIGGLYNPTIVLDEHGSVWTAGIHQPPTAPSITASGTGVTGTYRPYLTFRHKTPDGNLLIHESNLSEAGAALPLSNQGRQWPSLPTTAQDGRVNYVAGYLAVNGALPRFCWERVLGATSVTESVSDNLLKNARPAPVDVNGKHQPLRGVPPYATIGLEWHRRAFYVGDPPYRLWHSEIDEPESVWEKGYHDTDDFEAILGVVPHGDHLLVQGYRSAYALSGFGSDFRWTKVSNSVACCAPFSPVNVGGIVLQASEQGAIGVSHLSPSGFHNLMARTWRKQWTGLYDQAPLYFQRAQGFYDRRGGNYILLFNPPTAPKTVRVVGHLRRMLEEGASEPDWMLDKVNREMPCIGEYAPSGGLAPVIVHGGADGFVRKDDDTDDDDDGDTFEKELIITHGHEIPEGQDGPDSKGCTFPGITLFARNDNTELTVNVYAGDDDAASAKAPESVTIRKGAEAGKVAKTSHYKSLSRSAGKGATVQVRAKKPVGVQCRGYDLEYTPVGAQGRSSK